MFLTETILVNWVKSSSNVKIQEFRQTSDFEIFFPADLPISDNLEIRFFSATTCLQTQQTILNQQPLKHTTPGIKV